VCRAVVVDVDRAIRIGEASAPSHRDCGDGDEQVERCGKQKRDADAELRNQEEPGEQAAGNRPCGVGGVQHTHAAAERLVSEERRFHDQRERCAHQRGGHDQHRKGNRQA